MLRSQAAYGPHGSGASTFGGAALGRALFRVLPEDLYDRQPLTGSSGRFALVADVRLDNRDELLSALPQDTGRSELCDAGVLLESLEAWGERALDRVLGDYAFILWDGRARELLLARDPLGQRPLYYHLGHGFVAAASMPKGLHALDEVPRGADAEWLADFIGYVPHRGPRSHYRGISRVEAGHLVRIKEGSLASRRFWEPEPAPVDTSDFAGLRDRFRGELDRAVRARLRRRDGGVGAHLSGGWDSSAVAGTAAKLLAGSGEGLIGFTSVPRPGAFAPRVGNTFPDEGALAADAAAFHDNLHQVLVPGTAASPIAALDRIHQLYDRPLATLCNNVWLAQIRRAAQARGIATLLTGEVGNWTITAGHYTLLFEYLRQGRVGDWLSEAAALARAGRIRYRGIVGGSVLPMLPRRLQELATVLFSGPNTAAHTAAHPDIVGSMARKRAGLFNRIPKSHFGRTAEALKHRDFGDYRKGSLAGWGMDERDPTADRRLAEFCLSLPVDMLLKEGQRRVLARAALGDRVPQSILDHRLKGYQAADWHEGLSADRRGILDLLEEIASDTMAASLLDLNGMRQWVHDWPSGGWEDAERTARYRTALLVGLSAGHFAVRANR